mgnify:CR=1 FL=1
MGETTHQDEHERVKRDHIRDEDVSSPGGDHIAVKEGREHAPHGRALFNGADPEVKGIHEEEDGDSFVVIRAGDGSRDVA